MFSQYPPPIKNLIEEFNKLPGIGPKSAQRLVFHIMGTTDDEVKKLSEALFDVKAKIKHCSVCYNITEQDPCQICSDTGRNSHVLCVVSDPKDLIAIERTGEYKGAFHVLGG